MLDDRGFFGVINQAEAGEVGEAGGDALGHSLGPHAAELWQAECCWGLGGGEEVGAVEPWHLLSIHCKLSWFAAFNRGAVHVEDLFADFGVHQLF